MPEEKVISNWEEIDDNTTPVVSSWDETESTTVKKKDGTQEVTKPLNNGSAKSDVSQLNSNSQSSTSNSNSVSPLINNGVVPDFKSFDPTNGFGRNKLLPIDEKKKQAVKQALGTPTTVVEPQKVKTETPIETPQYDVSGATKQQSDNTDTGLVNISQQAESKRVAQEAEKVKREQELANPNSFQNIGTSYKEKALKTTGNNDIEKMLNFGDINGNKAFVEATLDDNDRHILGVTKEIEKINNDNKIYEQQLKSGAITQEIYDAHKKENTKKSIDLNAEYVKGIQSRNSAIDDEIKQSQTKLANGYDIKMLGAQPYYEPLTTQQIDEEKKKIKTLTDLKNDVLIDVNNPIKSLEKHEGFQNAEKDGLIPSGATNTQKVRIYSYILADKAKKLATELGYNPNDVKSLMGDKFGSNTPKMFWESAKSLIFGSNPKEKEFVHTMAELQAIAPISILNKNNLNLNEGYTSNIVSSFRKSVAPMFPRNQIATDQDRNALTQEAFNQAGVNQDVNSAYTTQQGNVDKESKNIGKTVSRTAGDIFGIGVKVAGINTLLGIPGQAIEMAVGKPVIQGLDKALSTSKEAQALEYTKLSETATKTASEAKKVEDAKKVLDVAEVVTEKLPNNFLTRTIYGTLKSGVVHEIQGRVNDELKGFANFGVGSVNHLIGMPINALGQVAIKMFGKEAPLFVEKVIQAAQSGTAMTATMAGMTVVNAARETEDMGAFKDVLDQHFGTKEKALRFVAENFLLGLALHAVNANTVSGLFKSKYDEGYSKLSPEEKAKVDDFVKDTNEKANDFETATKDAVEQVQKDDHVPLTTDKEIDDNAKALDQATNVNIQSQDFGAEAKQDAKIESAVIEIGGKIYEGKNHAEAILKAKSDGQDISKVNRQAQGKFKLSDGTIIDRAESKSRFGQDRSELMIPQDENAKEANKEYAKITRKPLSKIAEKIKLDENQVTPIKPINTGQEQNNIGGVQQTPENNQGVQQGDGQNVSNENEVAKVEEEQEVGSGGVGGDGKKITITGYRNKGSKDVGENGTFYTQSEQDRPTNKKEISFDNALVLTDEQVEQFEGLPNEYLAYEWFPDVDFTKEAKRQGISESGHLMDKMVTEEAIKRGYDGIVYGTNEIVDLRTHPKAVEQSIKETTKAETQKKVEQVSATQKTKQPTVSKTETTENPALKDVEATAKALEGVDVVQHLRDKTNALRDEQGNIPKDKMEKFKALRKASGAVNDGLVQIPESNYENTGRSKKFTPKQISEAYHKAKADGSNPELEAAVEDLLKENKPTISKEQQPTDVSKEEGSGVGGDVMPKEVSDLYSEAASLRFTLNALKQQMRGRELVGKSKAEYESTKTRLDNIELKLSEYEKSKSQGKPKAEEVKKEKAVETKQTFEAGDEANYYDDLFDKTDKVKILYKTGDGENGTERYQVKFENGQEASIWSDKLQSLKEAPKAEANKFIADKSNQTQHSIDITPEMKEMVQFGQPLFQVKDGLKEFVEDAKKEGYTKQETIDYVKDNNPEINEQDVIDTWDAVNENSNIPPTIDVETETISSDGKSVDKTLLKKRIYDNANQTEKERQEIEQKYGLKRDKIPHEEAKRIAKNIVDIYGLDNAIKKVRNGDIANGVAAEVYYLKFKDLDKEQKEAKTEEEQIKIIGEKANLASEWSNVTTDKAQFISQLGSIYKEDNGLLFNADIQKEEYKRINNGEISDEVAKKFDELEKELKASNKKIDQLELEQKKIEESIRESISKVDADAAVAEAYEKGKKEGTVGKEAKKVKAKIAKADAQIAEGLEDFLQAIAGLNMASGNVMPSVTKALKKIGKGLIDKGLATAENVFDKIVEHITNNTGKKPDIEDYRSEFEQKKQDSEKRFRIPSSRVKDIVERRRSENEKTTIDDVVEELKRDFPDKTEREIRDAITDYGVTKESSNEPDDVTVRKIKRMGRYLSALEDIENGIRPERSGLQRDKIDAEEREKLKEIREGLKGLPLNDADLSQKLKTAQDAIETRLNNEIEDLQREIDTLEKRIRTSNNIQTTKEIEDLKAKRDAKKEERDNLFQGSRYDDVLQELQDIANRTGQKTITKTETKNGLISDLLQAHIEKGTEMKDVQKQMFDDLQAIFPDITQREVLDAIAKKGVFKADDKEKTDLQKKLSELKKQLNYQTKIEDIQKGIIAETKKNGDSEKAKELRKQLSDAKKEAANKYPNVSANELQKKIEKVQKSIDNYKAKEANKDYFIEKKIQAEFHKDKVWREKYRELELLKLERAKVKAQFESEKDKIREKNLTLTEKIGENLGKLKRFDIFLDLFGMGRLALAAVARPITNPLREISKLALSYVVPSVMKKSIGNYRKGPMQSIRYLGKYYASYFAKKTYKDAISEFNKRSNFSLTNEDKKGKDRYTTLIGRILSAPEQAHGFMKAFAKLPQYNSTYEIAMENLSETIDPQTGELYDITDPLVQRIAVKEAYREANADVFMDDSDLAKLNSKLWNGAMESESYIIQLIGIYGKQLEPIIKVPANFYGEVMSQMPFVGFARAIMEINRSGDIKNKNNGGYRGVRNLTPEQAQNVQRKLTSQLVGFMGIAIGMMMYKSFGDDAEDELDAIEKWMHNTSFPIIMMGMELAKHLEDEDKYKIAKIPFDEIIHETKSLPQYRVMRDIAFSSDKTFKKLLAALITPSFLRRWALMQDNEKKRYPKTIQDYIAVNFPQVKIGDKVYVKGRKGVSSIKTK